MMMANVVVAVLLAGAPHSMAEPAVSTDELVGLWKAKRRFGPDGRGPLVVQRTGPAYTAEMMGRSLPVRVEQGELTFALPNGQGAFRGRLQQDGALLGHWFPPEPVAMGGHASPVRLDPDGPNRWSGTVVPFDDVFTFHLLVSKRADGSLGAILRNIERDFGALLGVDRITREGAVVKLFGTRRGQTQEREVAAGTYDAENAVITLDIPARGGSYAFERDGDESDFYPRGRNPGRYVYRQPLARDDGWPTATLDEVGIDRAAMEKLVQGILDMPMDTRDTPQIHAVLIARRGRLVLEEYFHGEHRDKLHETRSAAKSLTATLVGAAMQAGTPLRLSDPVYAAMNGGMFPPDLEPRKRAMTLEHLLTMSAGYFCDDGNPDAPGNENTMQDQTEEPDWYRYTLKVPMASEPGEKAIYCSSNPNLALGVASRATRESPMVTFDRLLGGPLKIHRYGWFLDPTGQPYGGGGLQFLPRDFMKLGQLMLNEGTWDGRRILDRDFVRRASSPLVHIGDRGYGYLWWTAEYPHAGGAVRAFSALGAGGQNVTVVPALDLVIASYGGNYSSRGWRHVQYELIPNVILPAVPVR